LNRLRIDLDLAAKTAGERQSTIQYRLNDIRKPRSFDEVFWIFLGESVMIQVETRYLSIIMDGRFISG
jgi:hypothetical protein